MFGYVRPLKAELKVREYEQFRSIYCGLCRTLKRRCGPLAEMVLSYDFTFLAMLLENGDAPCCDACRCVSHPFVKRQICRQDAVLESVADQSLILSWLKLRDNLRDAVFFKRIAAFFACALLYPAYRRAAGRLPEYAAAALELLRELDELEMGGCTEIDLTADKFARLTALSALGEQVPERRRILQQLLYHTGRWIYIIDAVSDLEEDAREGSYNAVRARYGALDEAELSSLCITLDNSLGLVASAYELLPKGTWSPILENIIYCGFAAVQEDALKGAREFLLLEKQL